MRFKVSLLKLKLKRNSGTCHLFHTFHRFLAPPPQSIRAPPTKSSGENEGTAPIRPTSGLCAHRYMDKLTKERLPLQPRTKPSILIFFYLHHGFSRQ